MYVSIESEIPTSRSLSPFAPYMAKTPASKSTNAELTARMISDQKNGWPFCPRCGKPLKIDPQTQRAASSNALSREVSGLYICDDCGSDEALRAFAGLPLPLEEWDQTRLINSMYK